MKKIVECVPNFSEGRNQQTIEAIAEAIRKTSGCRLLDVDAGQSTNRTVYTFVGNPEAVVEGALAAARVATERIDMRHHLGEHPRMGALDVCPFIPVSSVTMADCVQIAKIFGQRLAEELKVPVYLYEEAARHDYRRRLPDIRHGEYEGLSQRLADPRWQPDFGPALFVPTWGATVVGARMFLIAYNVNLLGTSNQAQRIALNLRQAGRGPSQPGRLAEVKAMGWQVEEYNLAQVTANLTNYPVTPPHVLFEEVKKEAAALSIAVAGSQIVGLVPLSALLLAADYYIEKEDLFIYQEDQKIRLAVERLGLNSLAPFNPAEKIIEYLVEEPVTEPLAGLSVRKFIEAVGSRTTAPGGGSAAAAIAALGAALGAMAAKLTYGVRRFEALDRKMRAIIPPLHEVSQALIPLIDADTRAYQQIVEALRLPKATEEEKDLRKEKLQAGLKSATEVPLNTMRLGHKAWDALREAARHANPACQSDLLVGAKALETGIWGAYQNVLTNIKAIEDQKFKADALKEAETLASQTAQTVAEVLEILGCQS
jgi:glutamate formiminotransferase/formiminotetrahydrofolate cyclodeaminase